MTWIISGDGKSWLSDQFQTCTPIETESDVMAFRDAMYEFYWGTAQYDYPPYQVNVSQRQGVKTPTKDTNFLRRNYAQPRKNASKKLKNGAEEKQVKPDFTNYQPQPKYSWALS